MTLAQRVELERVALFGARIATQSALRRSVESAKPTIELETELDEDEGRAVAYLRELYRVDEEGAC